MTPEQLKENIEDGLVRLKRDYAICYQEYDRAALKSLAHTLRYWVDMSAHVDRYLTEHNPLAKFSAYSTTPLFNRTFRNRQYIATCFPKRLILHARRFDNGNGSAKLPATVTVSHLTIPAPPLEVGGEALLTYSFDYKTLAPNECSLGQFIFVIDKVSRRPAPNQDVAIMNKQAFDLKKVRFGSWLNSLGARITSSASEGEAFSVSDLSCEDLIKRIANVLGGSHPKGGHVVPHDKDSAIAGLMEYELLGIPVPYMVLMKVAHDILEMFGSL
jgi:hypothetical protein